MGTARSMAFGVAVLLVLAGFAAPARAAASDWVGDARGAARLISTVDATGSSSRLDIGVQFRLAPGWHTYWRYPGDAGIAATFDWQGSDNLSAVDVAWPAPVRFAVSGLQTQGYEDGVLLPGSVALPHPGAPARLRLRVDYAVCSNICIPYHAELRLDLPTGLALPGPEAALITAARQRVPASPDGLGLAIGPVTVAARTGGAELAIPLTGRVPAGAFDVFMEGLSDGSAGPARLDTSSLGGAVARVPITGMPAAAIAGLPLTFTLVAGEHAAEFQSRPSLGSGPGAGERSLLAVIGVALLGGLILNLMPCVLPVLGLKLLAVARVAGMGRGAARRGLLATAAGVLASFMALAAAVIALRLAGAGIGWGIQFQQPWFLASMALATALFAANLWGWLDLALPGGAADAAAGLRVRGKWLGAFLSGAFATLLASSCSAPFVGTAVGFGLSGSTIDVVAVFAALGVGMAAPLLAGAAWPGFAAWLPRPGPWMLRLRQVLGLAVLGTAAWLLLVLEVVAGRAAAALVAAVIGTLLLVLLLCARRRPAGGSRRVTWAAIALGAALALLAVISGPGADAAAQAGDLAARSGPWQPFDQPGLGRAVAAGRTVFVDVTAAWCLTCKLNEATVLSRPPVRDRLRAPKVVTMRADWSKPDPAIAAYLESFGRFGVPMDVVYGPGAPHGIILPELLTSSAVTDALDRAAASPLN